MPLRPARRVAWRVAWTLGFVALLALDLAINANRPAGRIAGPLAQLVGALGFAAANTLGLWLVVRLSVRFPLGVHGGIRHLCIHGVAAVVLSGFYRLVDVLVAYWIPDPYPIGWPAALATDVANYALFAGAAHAFIHAWRTRSVQSSSLLLRAELAGIARQQTAAELRALRAELSPHFLGNALNTVSSLVRSDVATASEVLAQLSTLLAPTAHELRGDVPLDEELAALQPFVTIARAQVGGALTLVVDVPPDLRQALVPALLLQPLVENAVRHGLAPRGGGCVTIRAHRLPTNGELELLIADNGVGAHAGGLNHPSPITAWRMRGMGLPNVRARLAERHGERAHLAVGPAPDGVGTIARVTLPFVSPLERVLDDVAPPLVPHHANDDGPVGPGALGAVRSRVWKMRIGAAMLLGIAWLAGLAIVRGAPLSDGRRAALAPAALESLVTIGIWLAIAATAVRLVGRHSLRRGQRARTLAVHGTAAAGLGLGTVLVKLTTSTLIWSLHPSDASTRALYVGGAAIVIYAVCAGSMYAVHFGRTLLGAEAAALTLRTELAEMGRRRARAEIRALRAEVSPQLLRHALRDLPEIMRDDPVVADRVLGCLGDLLRGALARRSERNGTLDEELLTLEPLIAMERARAHGLLEVRWEITDDARDVWIPDLVLQPLLTHTVRSAIPAHTGGHVRIIAQRDGTGGERLTVTVAATSPQPAHGAATDGASSLLAGLDAELAGVRERLSQLFGGAAGIEVGTADEAHAVWASVTLPWRDEAPVSTVS